MLAAVVVMVVMVIVVMVVVVIVVVVVAILEAMVVMLEGAVLPLWAMTMSLHESLYAASERWGL
jgi:hypothetical protein